MATKHRANQGEFFTSDIFDDERGARVRRPMRGTWHEPARELPVF